MKSIQCIQINYCINFYYFCRLKLIVVLFNLVEDEILRDNLKGRVIELNAIDTLEGQGLEYSPKRDLSSYDIVAFVFDLGEKDSIKRVAQTIFMER